ncbi:MAG: hypothetical protein M0023_01610 [Desulfobacteraceae bacterium]|nr:hypothetical protein [Desulfobacteraceae bacterium]
MYRDLAGMGDGDTDNAIRKAANSKGPFGPKSFVGRLGLLLNQVRKSRRPGRPWKKKA